MIRKLRLREVSGLAEVITTEPEFQSRLWTFQSLPDAKKEWLHPTQHEVKRRQVPCGHHPEARATGICPTGGAGAVDPG